MRTGLRFVSALASLALLIGFNFSVLADENWYQHPQISPDGKWIVFSAKGDIYRVSSQGGEAVPLVANDSWDGYPIWSKDGKFIAFASNRNGSLDVYLMSLNTQKIERLTFHSNDDIPTDFLPDSDTVVFNSGRMHTAKSSDFPTGSLQQLYTVSLNNRTPSMLLTTATREAKLSDDGNKIVYTDNKAYENVYRKHDVSSFARDIWLYDAKSGRHQQLTQFTGGDSNPVWGDDHIYYLSENASNNFNVWRMDFNGKNKRQLTEHKLHPARSLSISKNGLMVYSWHGNLYTLTEGKKPQRLTVSLIAPKTNLAEKMTSISGKANRFSLSPNGKEIAFIARGELFVTSVEFGTTVRLTNSPEQERSISWFPDSRSIAYAAETNGSWGLHKVSIADESEPYFFAATKFSHETLIDTEKDEFQPLVSPDGLKVAYLHQRDEIRVINVDTKDITTIFPAKYNASYVDGDISYDWSPDSLWLVATFIAREMYFFPNLGIAPIDGSAEPVDITLSGYADFTPLWTDRESIQFVSGRYGRRNHGSWGNDFDVMSIFLTQDAYDTFKLSKEERELAAELEEKAKEEEDANEEDTEKEEVAEDSADDVEPIIIDWNNLDKRTIRLTKHSSNIDNTQGVNFGLTADKEKLYYLAEFEDGLDLWVEDFKEKSTSLALKLNAKSATMQMDKEGENAILLVDGSLFKVELSGSHKKTSISYGGDLALKEAKERAYLFDHLWRQTKDKFYVSNMHGIDWDTMYDEYYPKAANAENNYDFSIITSELLGELNASHTGTYYRNPVPTSVRTASLGVIYAAAPSSSGLVIEDILANSPLIKHSDKVTTGSTLTHIDGQAVGNQKNIYASLMGKAGQRTRLTVITGENTHDIVVKPVPMFEERKGLYERWVDSRRKLVEELSDGQLGYVHIPQMNDEAYRTTYAELFGRSFDKKAVVIDTRFNRGGWLTDDLVTLLSGKQYTWATARGLRFKGDSMKRWTKPSIVVMNEGNYSDGYCFPKGYTQNNVGLTVGMPVPGTCTAVWWETLQTGDLFFGIPQLGITDMEGNYLENNQLEPDIKISNTKESTVQGRDLQLEAAVKALLDN